MDLSIFEKARSVLTPIIRKTPLNNISSLVSDVNLFVKLENLQHTGSYKIRGAYFCLSQLSEEEKQKGVIAASAGNHAQGVAYAASKMGIKSTIVMPQYAPLSKVNNTKEYGANVILHGANFDEAYAHAKKLQQEQGLTFIEPFNDYRIIAGQGTIAFEILNQLESVDMVVVPIGGGGLISGIASVLKHLKPDIKVIGVEAEGAASLKHALTTNTIGPLDNLNTIADGIAVKCVGNITYEICKKYVDDVVIVSDDEIAQATLILLEKAKIISEGAGAASVAAILFNKIKDKAKNIVSIISGGNVDVNFLERLINRGLILQGRKLCVMVDVYDRPGNLNKLLDIFSQEGANVNSINHERTGHDYISGYVQVEFILETNGKKHAKRIIEILTNKGYNPRVRCKEVIECDE
ncbi:TPA: threonine ammonia-lyase [bacterium]|nr:threonine ammonia-lyase [bacterium]